MTMIKNRWSDAEVKTYLTAAGQTDADRDLALRVYTSRLIGQDPDLVMHGGGNTSVKTRGPICLARWATSCTSRDQDGT